jgi:hypothetical protein
MESALIAISGFLAGALLTSLWYSFGMGRDIIKVTTELHDHIKDHPVCSQHSRLQDDIRALEKK